MSLNFFLFPLYWIVCAPWHFVLRTPHHFICPLGAQLRQNSLLLNSPMLKLFHHKMSSLKCWCDWPFTFYMQSFKAAQLKNTEKNNRYIFIIFLHFCTLLKISLYFLLLTNDLMFALLLVAMNPNFTGFIFDFIYSTFVRIVSSEENMQF